MDDQKDLTSDSATKMAGTMLTAGLGRKSNFRDTMEAEMKINNILTWFFESNTTAR
jgi:hypothetical protein